MERGLQAHSVSPKFTLTEDPRLARILILSSWVAHGHVGLSAGVPALHALGHTVSAIPTTLLSNHLGFPACTGGHVDPSQGRALLDGLEANGWLAELDAVQTGFLPTEGHVDLAVELIGRARLAAPGCRVVVDPVLGDHPRGLYIDESAAEALREKLLQQADILTPNLFELGWLAREEPETLPDCAALAMTLGADRVIASSPPLPEAETGLLDITAEGATLHSVPRHMSAPNGTGDVLAALIAAGYAPDAALGHLAALVDASVGQPHLEIAGSAPVWTAAAPVPGRRVPPPEESVALGL